MFNKQKITGLVIAAGLSSRMGEFKPLVIYNDKSFICNIIDKLLFVCEKVVVVTGHNSEKLIAHVTNNYFSSNNVRCVLNSSYEEGMFTSVKMGVQHTKNSDWVLYHQVDQPNLPIEFYHELVEEIDINYNWIQPQFNGKKGHPIIFNKKIIELIKKENIEGSLRVVSNYDTINKKIWNTIYKEVLTDLDTPDDIKKMENK